MSLSVSIEVKKVDSLFEEVKWKNTHANLTVLIWRFAKHESPTRLIINSNSSGLIPGYTVSILVWGQKDRCYNIYEKTWYIYHECSAQSCHED